MKTVFWLVGLFAAAVALALLMGQNGATVTLFWLPYRVDMSFNLVLAAVLLLFVVLHMALRSVSALRGLPEQARRWRALQRERAVQGALLDAWVHQSAGRYVRAKGAAKQAVAWLAATSGAPGAASAAMRTQLAMAHVLAAQAAHALQDGQAQNHHLQEALRAAEPSDMAAVREAVFLQALGWAVDDRQLDAAQGLLAQLPQGAARRTLALRLKLKLAQHSQDHAQAFETARLLAKHKAFSPAEATSLLRRLRLALVDDCHDVSQLQALWRSMDAAERRDPVVVLAGLSRLLFLLKTDPAHTEGSALLREWAESLLTAYATLDADLRHRFAWVMHQVVPHLDEGWLARIEAMQAQQPADPYVLFVAAETCHHRGLWGKATAAFRQVVRLVDEPQLRALAWIRLAQLAERLGEASEAKAAWQQAALQGVAGSDSMAHADGGKQLPLV